MHVSSPSKVKFWRGKGNVFLPKCSKLRLLSNGSSYQMIGCWYHFSSKRKWRVWKPRTKISLILRIQEWNGRETTYTSIHLYYAMYLLNTISKKKKQYRNTPIPPFTSFSSHLKLSKHFGGKFQHLPFHSHQTLPETNSQFAAEKIGRNCPRKEMESSEPTIHFQVAFAVNFIPFKSQVYKSPQKITRETLRNPINPKGIRNILYLHHYHSDRAHLHLRIDSINSVEETRWKTLKRETSPFPNAATKLKSFYMRFDFLVSRFWKNQSIFHVMSMFFGVSVLNFVPIHPKYHPKSSPKQFSDQLDSLDLEKNMKTLATMTFCGNCQRRTLKATMARGGSSSSPT